MKHYHNSTTNNKFFFTINFTVSWFHSTAPIVRTYVLTIESCGMKPRDCEIRKKHFVVSSAIMIMDISYDLCRALSWLEAPWSVIFKPIDDDSFIFCS